MRKALQAEQSKAEMLIKIQNIEDDIAALEEDVDDHKRRINRLLKDEQNEKDRAGDDHQQEVNMKKDKNSDIMAQLKKLLTTFEEVKKEEEQDSDN